MHEVTEFPFGVPCKTRLWLSEKASREIHRFMRKGDPDGRVLKHLKRCAQQGFWLSEQGTRPSVKHEWSGVYRIGFDYSLFRLIGFYVDGTNKSEFVAIDAMMKHGQSLNAAEKQRINAVVKVKKSGGWRKASDGRFPRLAE